MCGIIKLDDPSIVWKRGKSRSVLEGPNPTTKNPYKIVFELLNNKK